MATEDRVTNMSTRLEALVTEPQHTSNPGDTVAIKSSDMSTGTSPECLLAKAKRREIDKDIFIDVVHHTIKTATLQLEARNYAAVQESILTVINLETISSIDLRERYKILEILGISYCQQRRWDEAGEILKRLVGEEFSTLNTGRETLRMMISLAEIRLMKEEFSEAEDWCKRAIYETKTTLGQGHALYHDLLNLRVKILERQGNHEQARGFQNLLNDYSFLDYVYEGNEEAVRSLLPLDQVSKSEKDTALIVAVRRGHEAIVRLLLANEVDIKVKDGDGQTVLMIAARHGHANIVSLLLGKEVDINKKDNFGETSLMLAAMNGHKNVVQVLLENGADATLRNPYMMTALDLAKKYGQKEIGQKETGQKEIGQKEIVRIIKTHKQRKAFNSSKAWR